MESIALSLPSGETINVSLDRKRMKTCRLKVFPNQSVVLALPESAPDIWAREFLESRIDWISKKLDEFKRTEGYAATKAIRSGYSIQMLGEDLVFAVESSDRDYVFREGKRIHICSTDTSDQEKLIKLFILTQQRTLACAASLISQGKPILMYKDTIMAVYDDYFGHVKPMIEILRSNDKERIAEIEDLSLDYGAFDDAMRLETAKINENVSNQAQNMKNAVIVGA